MLQIETCLLTFFVYCCRHSAVSRQSMLPQESAKKLAQVQEDMEDAVNKLELYKARGDG